MYGVEIPGCEGRAGMLALPDPDRYGQEKGREGKGWYACFARSRQVRAGEGLVCLFYLIQTGKGKGREGLVCLLYQIQTGTDKEREGLVRLLYQI